MRHCNESQTDQDKVWDDGYHVISTLVIFTSKVMLLQFSSFLDASFVESGNYLLEKN